MTPYSLGTLAFVLASVCLAPGCRCASCRQPATSPCAAPAAVQRPVAATADRPAPNGAASPPQPPGATIKAVGYEESPEPEAIPTPSADGLFGGQPELSLDQLIDLVASRNASLQAMTFAWQAAQQRYPQAIALDDPTFMGMAAPASFNSSTVSSAYVVGGSQKLPWFGKREARGDAAKAEANAMFGDVRDARLQLVQATRAAFFEYYLVARELEINRGNLELTRRFRDTARAKYENNLVTEQDVLQADVELATSQRRLLELERMNRVAVARLNTLLRRNPGEYLPAAPRELPEVVALPPVALLRQMAVTQRPDLAAIAARVRAEQAAVNLAMKQYFPDAEVYGRYDSFWQPAATQADLRGQVGVNLNMPIYRGKLNAAVNEAQFRLSQRNAEYRQKFVDVQFEVESAYAQVTESRQAIDLYRTSLLPVAEQSVETARENYDVGKTTFLNLLAAQQQLLVQREQYQQALAAYHGRRAELERSIGGDLPETVSEAGR